MRSEREDNLDQLGYGQAKQIWGAVIIAEIVLLGIVFGVLHLLKII